MRLQEGGRGEGVRQRTQCRARGSDLSPRLAATEERRDAADSRYRDLSGSGCDHRRRALSALARLRLKSFVPLVVTQIFCGILLGPSGMGLLLPELWYNVFS